MIRIDVSILATVFAGFFASQISELYGATEEAPNYAEHVSIILNSRCVVCHRSDGVAPFSLDNYADVKRRGRLIAEVVEDRYMPPGNRILPTVHL